MCGGGFSPLYGCSVTVNTSTKQITGQLITDWNDIVVAVLFEAVRPGEMTAPACMKLWLVLRSWKLRVEEVQSASAGAVLNVSPTGLSDIMADLCLKTAVLSGIRTLPDASL